jgi:hypothetical protein
VSSISHYLNRFKASLRIDHTIRDGVAQELYTHLEEKTQELEEKGLSREEASKIAVQSLGSPELIAEQMYETHAQGSWKEALLSASPHFMVALLFTSYYWQNITYPSIILALTVGIAVYGWHRGKPIWLFPWLGYYLLPVVVSGILLLSLPEGWGWMAALIYIPAALFVFVHIMRQTARRDWLYASLMLAPTLVTFAWFSSLGGGNELLVSDWAARLQTNALWIVVSFVGLAAAQAQDYQSANSAACGPVRGGRRKRGQHLLLELAAAALLSICLRHPSVDAGQSLRIVPDGTENPES